MRKPDFMKYADGLMPVIIQDASTAVVLMLGYMNAEALDETQACGKVVFYSRSKQRLWMKGETSGNVLNVEHITLDCDQDCLLIQASPAGAVCHTGSDTCFEEQSNPLRFIVDLERTIQQRKSAGDERSYVAGLFRKGINAIAQKVGEEAVELVIESKDDNQERFVNEAADLLFHYLVLLQAKGSSMNEVVEVLKTRAGSPEAAG